MAKKTEAAAAGPHPKETAVRSAAERLRKAIDEAAAAGFRVAWPTSAAGLDTIAVSETARVERTRVVVAAEDGTAIAQSTVSVASEPRTRVAAPPKQEVTTRTIEVDATES